MVLCSHRILPHRPVRGGAPSPPRDPGGAARAGLAGAAGRTGVEIRAGIARGDRVPRTAAGSLGLALRRRISAQRPRPREGAGRRCARPAHVLPRPLGLAVVRHRGGTCPLRSGIDGTPSWRPARLAGIGAQTTGRAQGCAAPDARRGARRSVRAAHATSDGDSEWRAVLLLGISSLVGRHRSARAVSHLQGVASGDYRGAAPLTRGERTPARPARSTAAGWPATAVPWWQGSMEVAERLLSDLPGRSGSEPRWHMAAPWRREKSARPGPGPRAVSREQALPGHL